MGYFTEDWRWYYLELIDVTKQETRSERFEECAVGIYVIAQRFG